MTPDISCTETDWSRYFTLHRAVIKDTGELFAHVRDEVCLTDTMTKDGKPVKIRRKMAYLSGDPVAYRYAGLTLQGQAITPTVERYVRIVNDLTGTDSNSVLVNLYEDGRDEIRWHSDKEEQIGPRPVIPTLNLGAARKFSFLHKESGRKTEVTLEDGDLLVMLEDCQTDCLHAVLRDRSVTGPRISLTFRRVSS